MFDDPKDTDSAFVEDGKYICKVASLEQQPPSPAHPDWGPGIKWTFLLADYQHPTEPVTRGDGEPYEYWAFTSAKLTPRSQGRQYVEALLGRPLDPQTDKGADLAAQLVGKKAIVMIGPKSKPDGMIRAGAILAMSPYKAPVSAGARSAAVAVLEDDKPPSLLEPGDTDEAF